MNLHKVKDCRWTSETVVSPFVRLVKLILWKILLKTFGKKLGKFVQSSRSITGKISVRLGMLPERLFRPSVCK